MQTGGVMPFVTFGTSNGDEDGNQDISLSLTNNGVGPAILGPIEIRYEGKPITTPLDLLNACCTEAGARALRFSTSPSTGIAVRPGDRKSVVWGKSVSVSVDLGGRRFLQKQKTK